MPANGRVAGIFQVGSYDEPTFVVAEWFPDPEQIEIEMIQMANAFDDWTEPLLEAKAAMIEDTRLHFETQSDPYGDRWEKLDDDYWHSKVELGGFPDQILVRTGELERAATGEEAWFINERSIFFDTGALPPHGPIHQEGTREGPKKSAREQKLLAISSRGGAFTAGEVEELQQLGTGRGLNLPQRMFIGADVDTIEEIEAIFIRHLDNTVTDKWNRGGNVAPLGFGQNVMGTFPIISFSKTGQPILRTPKGPRFGRRV